jgi:hypothetical protein
MCLEAVSPAARASTTGGNKTSVKQDGEEEKIEDLVRELHRFVLICEVDRDALCAFNLPSSPKDLIEEFWEALHKDSRESWALIELKRVTELFLDLIRQGLVTMPGQFKLQRFKNIKPFFVTSLQEGDKLNVILLEALF